MKWLNLLSSVLVFGLLTGCTTLNQSDRNVLTEHNVPPSLYYKMIHKESLPLSDVITLSQRHLPPSFIIHYLWKTDAVYRLSKSDFARLRNAGVSRDVIDYLAATESFDEPQPYGYHPRPVYPYTPYYAPYGYPTVIVGGGYGGG